MEYDIKSIFVVISLDIYIYKCVCVCVCLTTASSLSTLSLFDCFSIRLEMAGFYRFNVSSLTYMSLIIFLKGSYAFFFYFRPF